MESIPPVCPNDCFVVCVTVCALVRQQQLLLKAKVHHGCDGIGSAHSDFYSTQATSPCQCFLLPASLHPALTPNDIDPSSGNETAAKS